MSVCLSVCVSVCVRSVVIVIIFVCRAPVRVNDAINLPNIALGGRTTVSNRSLDLSYPSLDGVRLRQNQRNCTTYCKPQLHHTGSATKFWMVDDGERGGGAPSTLQSTSVVTLTNQ